MISVIYGAKGSGKTKRIIDAANAAGESASGQVVFITDHDESLGVSARVRFINLAEYAVKTKDEFIGFVKGMLATNFDIEKVYIDGMGRLLEIPAEKLKKVFDALKTLDDNVEFVLTVSADTLPKFMAKYAI
ncbi:MAG: hypothetical protein J1G04_04180 [Clostridiales bacterium]|nr:hypothetical protein [Clostridiales bacterium]